MHICQFNTLSIFECQPTFNLPDPSPHVQHVASSPALSYQKTVEQKKKRRKKKHQPWVARAVVQVWAWNNNQLETGEMGKP